jgi:hypothetical protein
MTGRYKRPKKNKSAGTVTPPRTRFTIVSFLVRLDSSSERFIDDAISWAAFVSGSIVECE